LGTIDGDRGLRIQNAYVVAFVDHVRHGTNEPLLATAGTFPEAIDLRC
jgi:hypothetical protein